MAAARQDDDEVKDKGGNMTTGGNDNTTTVGVTEMSTEESWRLPFEQGREIPRDKMMTGIERNTETQELKQTRQGKEKTSNVRRKNDGTTQEVRNKLVRNILQQKATRSQHWCRTEDVRTLPGEDTNVDRWR